MVLIFESFRYWKALVPSLFQQLSWVEERGPTLDLASIRNSAFLYFVMPVVLVFMRDLTRKPTRNYLIQSLSSRRRAERDAIFFCRPDLYYCNPKHCASLWANYYGHLSCGWDIIFQRRIWRAKLLHRSALLPQLDCLASQLLVFAIRSGGWFHSHDFICYKAFFN